MLDRLGDPGLAGEAAPERLVPRVVLLDELEGHAPAIGSGGNVDPAHPALSEQSIDVVAVDLRPDARIVHRSLMLSSTRAAGAPSLGPGPAPSCGGRRSKYDAGRFTEDRRFGLANKHT